MRFTDTAGDYARLLIANGFTIYAPRNERRHDRAHWFHYSRTVDGTICYGTFTDGTNGFSGPDHTMPITPSRLNGSGAHTDQRCHPLTVRAAEQTARPENYCPANYPATPDNVRRANNGQPLPARAATGTVLTNAEPWGIGTLYTPVTADNIETDAAA